MVNNKRVAFLFGAGASFGSGGTNRLTPLNKNLCQDLMKCSDYWKKISPEYIEALMDGEWDFETFMKKIRIESEAARFGYLTDIWKDAAIFLSEFSIDNFDENLYWKLINEFRKEIVAGQITLSTLNYDCLIEEALIGSRIRYDYFDYEEFGYEKPPVRLHKPNGSCNFIVKAGLPTPDPQKNIKIIMQNGTRIVGKNGPLIKPVAPILVKYELDNNWFPPAMCYIDPEKTNYVAFDTIEKIREEYREIMEKADLIVVVGVNPRLDGDEYIWQPIIDSKGVVGLVDEEEKCNKWREKFRQGRNDPILPAKFFDAYNNIVTLVRQYIK